MKILLLVPMLLLPTFAWAVPPDEECMVPKPYERPSNPFRLPPAEEQEREKESKKRKFHVPGTIREDGSVVKAKKWCDDPIDLPDPGPPLLGTQHVAAPPSQIATPEEMEYLKELDQGIRYGPAAKRLKEKHPDSPPPTPAQREKWAKEMDALTDAYEDTLPDCPPTLKREEVCIEKAYREQLKAARKNK